VVVAESIQGMEEEASTSSLVQVTPLVEEVATSSPDQVTALVENNMVEAAASIPEPLPPQKSRQGPPGGG